MNRNEIIAAINAQLEAADDETVEAIAGYVDAVTKALPGRRLSERERALLEASRRDFEAGRTYSLEESKARTDALLARYRTHKPMS